MGGKAVNPVPDVDPDLEMVSGGMFTVKSAAKFTGLSRAELYKLLACGDLPRIQQGRAKFIPKNAVLKFLRDALRETMGAQAAERARDRRGR